MIARKLKHLIIFDSLIKMELFKVFYVYINLENQFQIFIFEKNDLHYPDYSSWETNYIFGHKFLLIFPNVLKFSAYGRYSSYPPSNKFSTWNMQIFIHMHLSNNSILPKNAIWSL